MEWEWAVAGARDRRPTCGGVVVGGTGGLGQARMDGMDLIVGIRM